jgi:transcriptional regulator with XRE-family HTH domain
MRIPAPAAALRAARALTNLTQRAVAEEAGISQKSLSIVENSSDLLGETNLALVDFYVARGIEFMGQATVGSTIAGYGAKWSAPTTPVSGKMLVDLHSSPVGRSFRAARAMLGQEQASVASEANLTVAAVKGLEAGKTWDLSSEKLVNYYEQSGLEFTGWGDPASGKFFGVGVRFRT